MNKTKLIILAAAVALAAGCATRRTPAPVVDARAPKPVATKQLTSAPPPVVQRSADDVYTVKRGDTLYSIALEHGMDYRELAGLNTVGDPTRLRVGQQLKLKQVPAPLAPVEPERAAVQIGSAQIVGRVESRPLEALPPLPVRTPPVSELARMQIVKPEPQLVKADPVKTAVPAAPSKSADPTPLGHFIWPAKGKVLAEFAGPRKKGIDIDGKPGDPVVAAASGRVTYIGSGIPGMGKLVVLNHDNGFITVYAHNRNILVKEQQTVARGQRIAELGSSDAERPKLHFQIRKGAAAVDPMLYLPR